MADPTDKTTGGEGADDATASEQKLSSGVPATEGVPGEPLSADQYIRIRAVDAACALYARRTHYYKGDAIEAAKKFERFIRGENAET